jgi:hypothetical protein
MAVAAGAAVAAGTAVAAGAVVGRGVAVAELPQAIAAMVTNAITPSIHRRQFVFVDGIMILAPSVAGYTNSSFPARFPLPIDLAAGQTSDTSRSN